MIRMVRMIRIMKLAIPHRCSENVSVVSVIIPELKFSDVQMHVLAAHLMECADNAALEDRPETLNRLSVDRANYILALGMINEGVWVILIQAAIAHPLVSAEQTNLIRYRLMYECGQG